MQGQPWYAALPAAFVAPRLDHLWASCQPDTKCESIAAGLMAHMIRERGGMSMDQYEDSPLDGYVEAYDEFVKLVDAEQAARIAERRFVGALDRMCKLAVEVGSEVSKSKTRLEDDAHYRKAYEDDEHSVRIRRLNEMSQSVLERSKLV